MNVDARISVGLPSHPKTKKLHKRGGADATWSLVCLFLWAAQNRPDGDLSGMSDEDIELAANWPGEDGRFVAALVDVRFIDGEPNSREIHDWHEHNPWASGFEMRSAKARWNSIKRHHGEHEADAQVPEWAARRKQKADPQDAGSNASSTNAGVLGRKGSNAPSPSPSPSLKDAASAAVSGDPLKALWLKGLSMLTDAGTPEKSARSFLGKLRKEYGDPVLLEAFSAAEAESPTDPAAWLTKACQLRKPVSTDRVVSGGGMEAWK